MKRTIILFVSLLLTLVMLCGCSEFNAEPEFTPETSISQSAAPTPSDTTQETAATKAVPKESEAAAAEAEESYTFRTQELFDSHYEKHGDEFGDITQEEYLAMANSLINAKGDNILHKTEKEDGDYLYYNKDTNEFLVLSTDGYIRTYFKPDSGIDYWERQ